MKVMIPKSKEVNQIEEFVKSPIKLSISLLVSNRIETIGKCMESLKIILDAVPSELIAVDTIGEENSDGSLAVVREYTDKIVHFDWIDDFAAARNAGLELAQGEWFLYVDDDEWFEDPSELIEFFQSGEYLEYGCTQYAIRSYTDENMVEYSEGWVSRMGRRTPGMKFIHPVHEMLQPLYTPEKKFTKLFAHHVGYIFKNLDEKKKHFQRNIGPVLEELERHPENLRLTMQAIQEYLFDTDYEKAEELCRKGEENEDPQYTLVWNWIMTMLVTTLILWKKPKQALEEGQRILTLPRIHELARMNIDYVMVSAAQEIGDHETALKYAQDYVEWGKYFDENPDKVLEQVMLSLSDILQEDKRKTIHRCLFLTYKQLEQYDKLCEYADSIAWDQDYMKEFLYFALLIEAAANSENYDCITRVVEKLQQQDGLSEEIINTLQKACNCEDPEKRYALRKALARIHCDESYFLILKAWCAKQDGTDVQAALQECLAHGMDCAVPREELLGICLGTGNDPAPFLEPLYMEDWACSFSQLVASTRKDDLQELLDGAHTTLRPLHEMQCCVISKMIRQRMLDDPDFPEEQLWETAKAYVEDIIQYNRSLYRTELFEESKVKQNLPRETIFALKLQKALEAREQGNLDQMTEGFKECVEAYPPRKDLVNRLIDQVEREIQREQQQQEEFIEMGEKIKQQIHQLIRSGKLIEAKGVLARLTVFLPEDVELKELEKKISLGERLKNLSNLMN